MRRVRIQRILAEAISQGALATPEALARGWPVSVRTINRDGEALPAQGSSLPTRGQVKGIGRGQSHKAQLVGRWLTGETYDPIARRSHHALSCVKRYIQAFARVINLPQQGLEPPEIRLLLQMSAYLVPEYLSIYEQHSSAFARPRWQAQLDRLIQAPSPAKKGV